MTRKPSSYLSRALGLGYDFIGLFCNDKSRKEIINKYNKTLVVLISGSAVLMIVNTGLTASLPDDVKNNPTPPLPKQPLSPGLAPIVPVNVRMVASRPSPPPPSMPAPRLHAPRPALSQQLPPSLPPVAPRVVTAKKAILSDSLVDAITACVVLEAAGEGKEGMQAVTNVIMTRAKMLGGLDKAYNVVVKPWHFECFNSVTTSYPRGKPVPVEALEGKINQAKKSKSWQVARNLVVEGLAGTLPDITGGADHYYAQRIVKPKWAAEYDKTMKQTTVLGGHTFLTSPAVRSYWQRNGGQPNLPEIGY